MFKEYKCGLLRAIVISPYIGLEFNEYDNVSAFFAWTKTIDFSILLMNKKIFQ